METVLGTVAILALCGSAAAFTLAALIWTDRRAEDRFRASLVREGQARIACYRASERDAGGRG